MAATLDDVLSALAGLDKDVKELAALVTPKLRSSQFNKKSTAATPFEQFIPDNDVSILLVYITPSASGTFSVIRSVATNPSVTVTENLNNGVLNANQAYLFEVLATSDEQISFQFSANVTLLVFKVYEVAAMIG